MLEIDSVIGLIFLGLWIFGIFDVIASDSTAVRNLPKLVWLIIVVLLAPIGTIAWLFLGRPQHEGVTRRAPRLPTASGQLWRSKREPDPDDPAALQERIEARDRMMREWADQDKQASPGPSDERPPDPG